MCGGVLKGELGREFAADGTREVDSTQYLVNASEIIASVIPIRAWSLRQRAPSCLPSGDTLQYLCSQWIAEQHCGF